MSTQSNQCDKRKSINQGYKIAISKLGQRGKLFFKNFIITIDTDKIVFFGFFFLKYQHFFEGFSLYDFKVYLFTFPVNTSLESSPRGH